VIGRLNSRMCGSAKFKIIFLAIRADRPALTWRMRHIMHPTFTLLYSDTSPFLFRHQMSFRHQLYHFFG
jgi:hypothetical protein